MVDGIGRAVVQRKKASQSESLFPTVVRTQRASDVGPNMTVWTLQASKVDHCRALFQIPTASTRTTHFEVLQGEIRI
jgi:hypothetical protein